MRFRMDTFVDDEAKVMIYQRTELSTGALSFIAQVVHQYQMGDEPVQRQIEFPVFGTSIEEAFANYQAAAKSACETSELAFEKQRREINKQRLLHGLPQIAKAAGKGMGA